jgi:soluble lytic murein transglycosylase-like protein
MRKLVLLVLVLGAGLIGALAVWEWGTNQIQSRGWMGTTMSVPVAYQSIVRAAVERCPAIPAEILAAQIAAESGWNVDAVSPAGALGIAQFMPKTWEQYGIDGDGDGKADVWNPADAIHSAAALNCTNRKLVRKVPGDRLLNTLAAYNAGHGAVRKYEGLPPFPETQGYVERILDFAERMDLGTSQ